MKVLLTGGNGFVGSHILEGLLASGHDVVLLLRRTSDTGFIDGLLERVEVRYGELGDEESLRGAVRGAEAVVHCAGCTKAVRTRRYYSVNSGGTRNLVRACNAAAPELGRFVHVSSLAVSGPGTRKRPARETADPAPVSHYGRSKWHAERQVRDGCRAPFTILRPAAVYGPRDSDFFLAFRAAVRGLMPLIEGGRQPVSVVYAPDVSRAVLRTLGCAEAAGGTYHVASPVTWTQRALATQIAEALGCEPRRLSVPVFGLWLACLCSDLWAHVRGRPSILNLQKVAEYAAPGWVCSVEAARDALGFVAETALPDGLAETADWYRREGWL